MVIYLSLVICLLGAFVYALAANPKAGQLGYGAYQCGLLAFLLQIAPKLIELLKG
jgi:hypothetical protein